MAELEGDGEPEASNSAYCAAFHALSRQPSHWMRTQICFAAQIASEDACSLLSSRMRRSQKQEMMEEGCTLSLAWGAPRTVRDRIVGMACWPRTLCRCFRRRGFLGVLASISL